MGICEKSEFGCEGVSSVTNKVIFFVGVGLTAVSMKFAGVAVAAPAPTTFAGPSSTTVVTTVPDAGPAAVNAPTIGADAASADAKGSLGNASPTSTVCEQNAGGSGSKDGALVNTSGSDSAFNKPATDGTVVTSASAVPQVKAQQMAIAIA